VLLPFWSVGCRTVQPSLVVDLSEPGWRVRQGQAVWRPKHRAPELAGELLVAAHADGRTLVQFTKTPFPIVAAQATPTDWQIHFAPRNRTLRGSGEPPRRFIWLHLARCLNGSAPPRGWSLARREDATWRFESRATGETLEGYLTP
jgi:hypothetical protein